MRNDYNTRTERVDKPDTAPIEKYRNRTPILTLTTRGSQTTLDTHTSTIQHYYYKIYINKTTNKRVGRPLATTAAAILNRLVRRPPVTTLCTREFYSFLVKDDAERSWWLRGVVELLMDVQHSWEGRWKAVDNARNVVWKLRVVVRFHANTFTVCDDFLLCFVMFYVRFVNV